MNKIKFLIICLFVSIISFAQENQKSNSGNLKNTVFVEALGNGLFGSINYERQLTKEPGLSLRAGIGFYTENEFYLTIPTSIQYLISLRNNNFIETGVGYTWADAGADDIFNDDESNNSDNLNNLFLSIGYRKHFGNDWMWKANFTPLITNNKDVTLPWIGISIGKRF
mgnify:CR=1 FL=1|jgi:hypothetical protein